MSLASNPDDSADEAHVIDLTKEEQIEQVLNQPQISEYPTSLTANRGRSETNRLGSSVPNAETEVDLTEVEKEVPLPSPIPPQIPTKPFDEKRHRAVTAEKAVWALFGLLYLIVCGAFILLWHGTPVHEIELLIFALLALVGIIAGPILGFFFGERHAS